MSQSRNAILSAIDDLHTFIRTYYRRCCAQTLGALYGGIVSTCSLLLLGRKIPDPKLPLAEFRHPQNLFRFKRALTIHHEKTTEQTQMLAEAVRKLPSPFFPKSGTGRPS
jgi:hypothetical protein